MIKIDMEKLFSGLKEIPSSEKDYDCEIKKQWKKFRTVLIMIEADQLDFSNISETTIRDMLELYNGDEPYINENQTEELEKNVVKASKIFAYVKSTKLKKVADFAFC